MAPCSGRPGPARACSSSMASQGTVTDWPCWPRLAATGLPCLSIDLPSHFHDRRALTLGTVSEAVTEAGLWLASQTREVFLLGHSLGALGVLFATAGFSRHVEGELYQCWEELAASVEAAAALVRQRRFTELATETQRFEQSYERLKQVLFTAAAHGVKMHARTRGLTLLSAPASVKGSFPAISLLRHLPRRWVKRVFEKLFHEPAVKQLMKEGNPGKYVPEKNPLFVNAQFFKTAEPYEFLNYILSMKEPGDFLQVLEAVSRFRHRSGKVTMVEYYLRRLRRIPKLFVYGSYDFLLRPFLPWQRRRLEYLYASCGHAQIRRRKLSHILVKKPWQQMGFMAVTHDAVTKDILYFIARHQ